MHREQTTWTGSRPVNWLTAPGKTWNPSQRTSFLFPGSTIATSSSTVDMADVLTMSDGWWSLPTTVNGRHVSFLAKTSFFTVNCQDTLTGTNTVSLPSTMEGWGWITISRNVPSGIKRNLSWVSAPLNLSLLRLQLTKLKQFLAVEKRIIDGQAKIWNFS